jgi:DNA-directed RNA polymerase subunit E'/Rpb7
MSFNNYYYFKEAFQENDMNKALSLIKSFLEKKLGVKLYQKYGIDYFKNNLGSGEGIRYFLPDDRAVRFNFNNNEIVSVDIWKAQERDPSIRIDTKGISVVKILPFNMKNIINKKILAIWFMDDGSTSWPYRNGVKISHNASMRCKISSESFSYQENLNLKRILAKKFKLIANVKFKFGNTKPYLQFNSVSSQKLIKICKKYRNSSFDFNLRI